MDYRLALGLVPASLFALLFSACLAGHTPPDQGPGVLATPPPAKQARPTVATPAAVPDEVTPPSAPPDYIPMHASAVVATWDGEAVLLLDESEAVALPIFVGTTEATSIRWRLEKRRYQRPLTHDLIDALMRELGGQVVKAQVDDLKSNTFIGSVFVRAGGRVLELDSRPSDAIALAVGSRAPIFVACRVLETSAIPRASLSNPAQPSEGDLHIEGCPDKSGPAAAPTGI